MDYKELIKQLKRCKSYKPKHELQQTMLEAATAIETMLAERDAAVEGLTQICQDSGDACHLCKHLLCVPKHDRCIGWQWRGPSLPDRE